MTDDCDYIMEAFAVVARFDPHLVLRDGYTDANIPFGRVHEYLDLDATNANLAAAGLPPYANELAHVGSPLYPVAES